MPITAVTDHWTETVSEHILEQFKGADNWKAVLKSVIDEYSYLEGEIWKLAPILDFKKRVKGSVPTGALLDFVAGIVGVSRLPGESDPDFYERFLVEVAQCNAGTPDNIIYNAAIISSDQHPSYIDEVDATFFVYTGPKPNKTVSEDSSVVVEQFTEEERKCHGGGNQLLRRQVQQTAPAGVLGLPGAAIQFADGSFMCDAQGRIFLAAADDSSARRELLVVDNNLRPLVTPQGTPIRAVIVGATVPRVEINYNGSTADAVRIKDLPDAGYENAFMVRDSDTGGTTRIDENDVGLQMQPSGTNTLRFFKR